MQSPLRKLRKSHGMTLLHVATGVQVDPATLSRIERCEQVPSVELATFSQVLQGELHILYPSRYQVADDASKGNRNAKAAV
jgi:transcriptional regulator with XRE-family HTH domain